MGTVAKRQAVTNPENTIFSVKRFMGRKYSEVDEEMKIVPYEVVRGSNGDARIKVGDKEFSPPGDQRDDPPEAEGGRRGLPRRDGDRRRPHRPGVLQRRPAPGDQGRRQDRRPRGQAHHQRADRGRPGLRARQGDRPDDPGLRPRRRHVRRVGARDRRRGLRGQVHRRRQPPRRRQLRQGDRRLDGRRVQGLPGHRPEQRPDGPPAPVRGGREGQDRALDDHVEPDQPAVHHGRPERPEAPRPAAHPGEARGAGPRPARAARRAAPSRRSPTPASASTTWCSSAA